MSSYRIEVPQLENITRAIGYVCVFWASLEDAIDILLTTLLPLEKITVTPEEKDRIAHAIVAGLDMRDKIKMLRAVAFLRKIDMSWFKKLTKILDRIDNELRIKRNRFVHDSWVAPQGRIQRINKQIKFKKPKAFVLELLTEERTSVKMKEVWDLGKSIVSAQMKIVGLAIEFKNIDDLIKEKLEKTQLDALVESILFPLLPKSEQQYSRPEPTDTHQTNERSKRKRRPRSSSRLLQKR
jgi:DNA polymerase III delta prime subunit